MFSAETKNALALVHSLRQRFLNRIRDLGIVREGDLIRVHRLAQDQKIAPEDAVVALGILTEDRVMELLVEGPHLRAPREFAGAC